MNSRTTTLRNRCIAPSASALSLDRQAVAKLRHSIPPLIPFTPYLVSSAVSGMLAQQLVRAISGV